MAATVILTTSDPELEAVWARQLSTPATSLRSTEALAAELMRPGARVWIKDVRSEHAAFPIHNDTIVVAVGEPRSIPFESAKRDRSVAYALSYEDSNRTLGAILKLAGELAEARAVMTVFKQRPPLPRAASAHPFAEAASRGTNDYEFVEAALDHLDDMGRIVEVFKRGMRTRIRASKVAIFLRKAGSFTAEAERFECHASDEMVIWLQQHAAIVDLETLEHIDNPLMTVLLRQKLNSWGARLLIPIEVHGALAGWVCCGPRADARPYSVPDRDDALSIVSLLSRFISQHNRLKAAERDANETKAFTTHGPKIKVIGDTPAEVELLPVELREVVALAKRERKRVEREFDRLRVCAGPIDGGSSFWVLWDDEGATAGSIARKLEEERFRMLHDLGLVLSHELANAMFSLSTYFQFTKMHPGTYIATDALNGLIASVTQDVAQLVQRTDDLVKSDGGAPSLGEAAQAFRARTASLQENFSALVRELRDQSPDGKESGRMAKMVGTVEQDMARLRDMPHLLVAIYEMAKKPTVTVDMKRLVQLVAKEVHGVADLADDRVLISGHEENLKNALSWLCHAVKEQEKNDSPIGDHKIRIRVQMRQRAEDEAVCLVSIAYPGLRLEELKVSEPTDVSEFPTTGVYLAREIIRYHYGTIHIGQGLDGPELFISLKSRRNQAESGSHDLVNDAVA